MLMPKRVKHRKVIRGRMKGIATRGNVVTNGEYWYYRLWNRMDNKQSDRSCQSSVDTFYKKRRTGLDKDIPG